MLEIAQRLKGKAVAGHGVKVLSIIVLIIYYWPCLPFLPTTHRRPTVVEKKSKGIETVWIVYNGDTVNAHII